MPSTRHEEFLSLPFKAKLEFLYGLPARQKRDLILSAPEAERLVQLFLPETLFYSVMEIGSPYSGGLLSLAVPEQIQGLFDLDCWTRDRPNLDRMREWIEALTEAGRKRMTEGLMGLDMEMMALLLRQYFRVHRLDDPLTAADVPSDRFVQFDEHYIIEFQHHDAILQPLVDFLEEVFERDYTYFTALMEEIYWSVEAELEEEAYQFRRARLNDRGFPDFFDAQDVFAYVNPREFLKIRAGYTAPTRADLLRDARMDLVLPAELALDLVTRGHRLVADDIVDLKRKPGGSVYGSGSEIIKHHMEIRGIGIINIKDLFGVSAVRERKNPHDDEMDCQQERRMAEVGLATVDKGVKIGARAEQRVVREEPRPTMPLCPRWSMRVHLRGRLSPVLLFDLFVQGLDLLDLGSRRHQHRGRRRHHDEIVDADHRGEEADRHRNVGQPQRQRVVEDAVTVHQRVLSHDEHAGGVARVRDCAERRHHEG